jgi:hypothetical protein
MIKHLKPRSNEELHNLISSEPIISRKHIAKRYDIKLSEKEIQEYEQELKIYAKNGFDDAKLMKLIEKGKPIHNKKFILKYPAYFANNTIIDHCHFELFEEATLVFSGAENVKFSNNIISVRKLGLLI